MSKDYLAVIDIGTQSSRVIVFDTHGNVISKASRTAKPYYSKQPGWAELPSDQVWNDCKVILKEVTDEMGEEKNNIRSLAITANRDNIMPLDENLKPMRDWIIWLDKRQTPEAVYDIHHKATMKTRVVSGVARSLMEYAASNSKFNWLKYNEPEIHQQAAYYCTLSGYLTLKLTGKTADATGMQCGFLPFDNASEDWFKYDFIYEVFGVRRDQMFDLVKQGGILGNITADAAQITGLPEGLPVVATAGDKQVESLGAGAFTPEEAVISYGTMASLSVMMDKAVSDSKFKFNTFPSALEKRWNAEFNIYRGYWLITWFCRQYTGRDDNHGEFLREMDEAAQHVPAGSNGLFLFPFFTPHEGFYPRGKGAIFGLTDAHHRADIFRCFLEGIAFAMRQGLDVIEKASKQQPKRVVVCGGGSRSDVGMQITADILNRPTVRLNTIEVCAIGAAILGGMAVGVFKSAEEGVKAMREEVKVFTPNPENVKIYEDLYKNVYLPYYNKNKDAFQVLDKYSHLQEASPEADR